MLASADTIKVVANALKKYSLKISVIDPVANPYYHVLDHALKTSRSW